MRCHLMVISEKKMIMVKTTFIITHDPLILQNIRAKQFFEFDILLQMITNNSFDISDLILLNHPRKNTMLYQPFDSASPPC